MNSMIAGSIENPFQWSQFANQFSMQEERENQIELHVH